MNPAIYLFFSPLLFAFCTSSLLPVKQTVAFFAIEVKAKDIGIDVFDQIYLIDNDNRLVKYNKEGQKLSFYSNHRLGRPSTFDLSNPHKILLFYPDYQTVVFLDRNLTYTSSQNLSELGLPEIKAVGMTNDNNLWIYDEFENILKKAVPGGEIQNVSENTWPIWGLNIRPVHLTERFNKIFLSDPVNGIFIFNNLGFPVDFIETEGVVRTEPVSNDLLLVWTDKRESKYYSFRSAEFIELSLPSEIDKADILQISKSASKLLLRKEDRILIYRTNRK